VAAARAVWRTDPAGFGGIAPERLVFLDERGVLTNMARLWGRCPRGQRAVGTVPCGRWTRLTVLGALGTGGVVAAMAAEAATDGAVFQAWLEEVLLPKLRHTKPDAVLVLDNPPAGNAVRLGPYACFAQHHPSDVPCGTRSRVLVWPKSGTPE
jgi:hypothetical protein